MSSTLRPFAAAAVAFLLILVGEQAHTQDLDGVWRDAMGRIRIEIKQIGARVVFEMPLGSFVGTATDRQVHVARIFETFEQTPRGQSELVRRAIVGDSLWIDGELVEPDSMQVTVFIPVYTEDGDRRDPQRTRYSLTRTTKSRVRLADVSEFSLVNDELVLAAELEEDVDPGDRQFEWFLRPRSRGDSLSKVSSEPGVRSDRTRFLASSEPGETEIGVRLGSEGPWQDSTSVTVWSITRPDERKQRVSQRSVGYQFDYQIRPVGLTLMEVMEKGAFKLESAADSVGAPRYRIDFRVEDDGEIRFDPASAAEHFKFAQFWFEWDGHWTMPEEVESDSMPPSGDYRLDLVVNNAGQEATVSYEIFYDRTSTHVDLTGYWRASDGPAEGWLMAGESFGNGAVALHTAPDVVIEGTWSDDGEQVVTTADALDASVDLVVVPGGVEPKRLELNDLVEPPAVITGLREVEISGEREHALYGTPEGIDQDRIRLAYEGDWEIEILRDRTTHWFAPGDDSPQRQTSRGIDGGSFAQVRFERKPEPLIGTQGKGAVGRVRLLDSEGTILDSAFTAVEPGVSPPEAPLTIDISGRTVHGEVKWTGMEPDGEPHPPGVYTLELLIRDGMAQQELRRKILVGNAMSITKAPEKFAPGIEDVVMTVEFVPEETAPSEVSLTVRGGSDFAEDVLTDRLVTLRRAPGGFQVKWDGTGSGSRRLDWATLAPFRIEIHTAASSGDTLTDFVDVAVEPVALKLDIEDHRPSQLASFYREDEISADKATLKISAQIELLTSTGDRAVAPFGPDIHFEEEIRTLAARREDERPHGLSSATRRQPAESLDQEILGRKAEVVYHVSDHAMRYNYSRNMLEEGDRFRIVASLDAGPEFNLSASSEWLTVAPGVPTAVVQLDPDQLFDRNIDRNWVSWTPHDVATFTNTLASQATGLFVDTPVLKQALEVALREHANVEMRYVGNVRGVPYRGLFGGATSTTDMEVYVAGIAGDLHSKLIGGQALAVFVEVTDKHGNPIPINDFTEPGGGQRSAMTHVKVGFERDPANQSMPAFFLGEQGGDRFVANSSVVANARHPVEAPLGLFPFYYVPGYPFAKVDPVEPGMGELEQRLRSREYASLKTDIGREVDENLQVFVDVGSTRVFMDRPVQLVAAGSLQRIERPTTKWLRWAIAGDVSDVETFKAEVLFSVIPIVGDGRDLVVYGLKNLLSSNVSGWDHFFATLALVGLALDVGDVTIIGILPNAVVAVFKASGKTIVGVFDRASGMAKAFLEVMDPMIQAARRSGGIDNLDEVVAEVVKHENFVDLMTEAAKRGRLNDRLRQIGEFVNTCNPKTCLIPFFVWGRELSEYFLDVHARHLPDLVDLFKRFDDADQARAVFTKVRQLSEQMGFLGVDNTPKAFENLISLASRAENPARFIDELLEIPGDALRAARPLLSSDAFIEALEESPAVWPKLRRALAEDGASTVIARATIDQADSYRNFLSALDKIDDLVPRLRRLLDDDLMRELAGRAGLAHAMEVIGDLARRNTDEALETANLTLRMMDELRGQFRNLPEGVRRPFRELANGELRMAREAILFEDIQTMFRGLGPEKFATYMKAVDSFRDASGGLLPGLLWPASKGASSNFLLVARHQGRINFALEIVGTRWLIDTGTSVNIPGRGALRVRAEDVQSFGHKARFGENNARTLEADTRLDIDFTEFAADEVENVVVVRDGAAGVEIAIDWKNYRPNATPRDSDILKAANALTEGAVENVVFLSPRGWSRQALNRIAGIEGLFLGEFTPTGILARFL